MPRCASITTENPQLFEKPGGIHLTQILIIPKPNPARADESAWKKAEETAERARARIMAGEQFAAVARDMSEAPDASQGGDLGMLPAGELPPFFVELCQNMKPGDLSGAFRSEFGVHVIKLIATEVADTVPFEKAEPVIRRMLHRVKVDDVVLDFCEPIVNDSEKTKIFIQLDRVLAAQGEVASQVMCQGHKGHKGHKGGMGRCLLVVVVVFFAAAVVAEEMYHWPLDLSPRPFFQFRRIPDGQVPCWHRPAHRRCHRQIRIRRCRRLCVAGAMFPLGLWQSHLCAVQGWQQRRVCAPE
jgi:hypothetical protein